MEDMCGAMVGLCGVNCRRGEVMVWEDMVGRVDRRKVVGSGMLGRAG